MLKKLPPIGVFAYNRPLHLKMCLEAIDRSQHTLDQQLPVFIYCDAPRVKEHEEKCARVWEIAKQYKNGTFILRDSNQGFRNITQGVTELCEREGKAIIIEDDIIVAPDFLPYMCESLKRYEHDEKVYCVSGFMYDRAQPKKPSTFFLPTAFIWGWGTWERAWKRYSWTPEGADAFFKNKKQRKVFDFLGAHPFSKMLDKTLSGRCNTWDIQWAFTIFRDEALALYPYRSLVWNCGVGGGTHGKDGNRDAHPSLAEKEAYIHGEKELEDFFHPQLNEDFSNSAFFPSKIASSDAAYRRLALTFIKQRLRQEKKLKHYLKYASILANYLT